MRKTVEGSQTVMRWQFMNKLDDLDSADNIVLVASKIVDRQTKVENPNINGKKTGLKFNHGNEMEC